MKSAISAAILAALMMATLGIFSRTIHLDAEVVIFFRLFFGGLLLLLLLLLQQKQRYLLHKPHWSTICSGIFLAAFAGCYFKAMSLTTLVNAVIILYLAPIAASIFAHFFMGERLRMINLLLIGLALFGFATILEFNFHLTGENLRGLLFALGSMATYAAFICCNRVIPATAPVYAKSFLQLLVGTLCIAPFAFADGAGILLHFSATTWLWLLAVGLFPGFLGTFLAVWALTRLSAVTFGTFSYLEPIFVILFGWLLFNEQPGLLQAVGCCLVIISGIMTGIITARQVDSTPEKQLNS